LTNSVNSSLAASGAAGSPAAMATTFLAGRLPGNQRVTDATQARHRCHRVASLSHSQTVAARVCPCAARPRPGSGGCAGSRSPTTERAAALASPLATARAAGLAAPVAAGAVVAMVCRTAARAVSCVRTGRCHSGSGDVAARALGEGARRRLRLITRGAPAGGV
jgi:hypothetical protein